MRTFRASAEPVDLVDRDRVDTTLLLEELKRKYRAGCRPLEVSFRGMVSWVRPGDQLTHLIHPYPAKLLPHIAHFFSHAGALRRTLRGETATKRAHFFILRRLTIGREILSVGQ